MTKQILNMYFLFLIIASSPAHAYIGPGAGVGVIFGAIMFVVGLLLLFVAVIWFPLKRKFKSKKKKSYSDNEKSK